MILQGEKVLLRAVEPSDSKLILEWENNVDNWQLSNTLTPFSKQTIDLYIETAQQDIFETKQLRLMIDSIKDEKTIGAIDLFDYDPFNQRAGVGILINDNSDKRKGYAADSLSVLIEYCNDILALNQLYCDISVNNIASINLFEKQGFKLAGTRKKWLKTKANKWEDILFFQYLF